MVTIIASAPSTPAIDDITTIMAKAFSGAA